MTQAGLAPRVASVVRTGESWKVRGASAATLVTHSAGGPSAVRSSISAQIILSIVVVRDE